MVNIRCCWWMLVSIQKLMFCIWNFCICRSVCCCHSRLSSQFKLIITFVLSLSLNVQIHLTLRDNAHTHMDYIEKTKAFALWIIAKTFHFQANLHLPSIKWDERWQQLNRKHTDFLDNTFVNANRTYSSGKRSHFFLFIFSWINKGRKTFFQNQNSLKKRQAFD